ncbi:uncharacterized protein LOC126184353 [Schistocerca cancellata]|uniref:uncharacterized protein LOC126184353 n=1 Tax=Schistocerca cancellata TaxID=274614 RepID=UPI002119397B|nr:uncharacterized protein LOC126184353 [Schistocerca cancellata]
MRLRSHVPLARQVEIPRATPVGAAFLRVRATDADECSYNAEVYYALVSRSPLVALQRRDGAGLVALQAALEPRYKQLSFTVLAYDGGSPRRKSYAKCHVTIKNLDAPEAPEAVITGNSWAMICWNVPKTGSPLGYFVNLKSLTEQDGNYTEKNYNFTVRETAKNRSRSCAAFPGLQTSADYEFTVTAWNDEETGITSAPVTFNTRVNRTCSSTANNGYECSCVEGFYGEDCESYNPCVTSSALCLHGGTCRSNSSGTYLCSCSEGYFGMNCEHFNPCSSSPCQHGSVCVNIDNSKYKCNCVSGYTGEHCETVFDECESQPCQNGGLCSDEFGSFLCTCSVGFTGKLCELDIDECTLSPCLNGGCCSNSVGSYSCACRPGFEGKSCEVNINECSSSPCSDNGLCVDGANNFTCSCYDGFEGEFCEKETDECVSNICYNGGTCQDDTNDYHCLCPPGYSGKNCETDIDFCASSPCKNDARCLDEANAFSCICEEGYHGDLCQFKVQCPNDTLRTEKGTFVWDSIDHGMVARQECPYGADEKLSLDADEEISKYVSDLKWKALTGTSMQATDDNVTAENLQVEGEIAYAVRRCVLRPDGSVAWTPMLHAACRREEITSALQMIGYLQNITKEPHHIDGEVFCKAAAEIQKVLVFALRNRKIAESMVLVISNLMNVNESVLQTADANGTVSQSIVKLVDKYTSYAILGQHDGIAITTDNMIVNVLDVGLQTTSQIHNVTFVFTSSAASSPTLYSDANTTSSEIFLHVPTEAVLVAARYMRSRVRARFVCYKNGKFFRPLGFYNVSSNETTPKLRFATEEPVMSVTISNVSVGNLSEALTYSVPNIFGDTKQICAYWETNSYEWLTYGLKTNQTESRIICESDHMTHFSILLDPGSDYGVSEEHKYTLSIISYVGSFCSIFGLTLTIVTYATFRSLNRDRSGKILLNLCVSLLLMNLSFLLVMVKNNVHLVDVCILVAILTHYFVLTSLAWMLVEAVNMYQLLITVFATSEIRFMLKRMIFAWGVPLIIVASTATYDISYYNSTSEYCMLNKNEPYVYYITYLGPSCIMLAVNCVVFVLVSRVLFQKHLAGKVEERPENTVSMSQVRGAFAVMTLLGVTWVFGAFAFGSTELVFQYLFCISNSLQGFIIFIVRCVQYSQARLAWAACIRRKQIKEFRGAVPSSFIGNSHSLNTVSSSICSQSTHKVNLDKENNSNDGGNSLIWGKPLSKDSHSKSRGQSYSSWKFQNVFNTSSESDDTFKCAANFIELQDPHIVSATSNNSNSISGTLKKELEKTLVNRPTICRTQSMHVKSQSFSNDLSSFKRGNSIHCSLQLYSKAPVHMTYTESQDTLTAKEGEDTSWQFMRTQPKLKSHEITTMTVRKETPLAEGDSPVTVHASSNLKEETFIKTVSHSDQGYISGICTTEHSPDSPCQKPHQIHCAKKYLCETDSRLTVSTPDHISTNSSASNKNGSCHEPCTEVRNLITKSDGNILPPKNLVQKLEREKIISHTFIVINGQKIYTNNPSVRLNAEQVVDGKKIDVQCVNNSQIPPILNKDSGEIKNRLYGGTIATKETPTLTENTNLETKNSSKNIVSKDMPAYKDLKDIQLTTTRSKK